MLALAVNLWLVLAPVIAAQYILAVITLYFLFRRKASVKSYVIWSIVILIVFFVGAIVFFVYDKLRPSNRS